MKKSKSKHYQKNELKPSINKFGLTQIDLSDQNLSELPEDLFSLHKLQMLLVPGNRLISISTKIGRLQKLKLLDVSRNKLPALPETLSNCVNLIELYVHDNRLSKLPLQLLSFHQLSSLRLADNLLEKLPQNFGQLVSLRRLDLSKNSLWFLPDSFSQLTNLVDLSLAENVFVQFPNQLVNLSRLESFDISQNQLSALPPDMSTMKNLRRVAIAFNKFAAFPPSLCDLKHLEYLDASNNRLTSTSSRLAKLPQLRIILLNNNFLRGLLDNLPIVEYLNITCNALSNLSVVNMRRLRRLDVSKNQLSEVPNGVYNLRNLEELNLSNNQIGYLSQDVVLLTKLKKLDICGNRIKLIPKSLYEMENLIELNTTGSFKKVEPGGPSVGRPVDAYLVEPASFQPKSPQPRESKNKTERRPSTKSNGSSRSFFQKLFFSGASRSKTQKINKNGMENASSGLTGSQNNISFAHGRQGSNRYFYQSPENFLIAQTALRKTKSAQNVNATETSRGAGSRQAWSDETGRLSDARKLRNSSDLHGYSDDETALAQNFAGMKPYHDIENPVGWAYSDALERQPSIRFQEDYPSRAPEVFAQTSLHHNQNNINHKSSLKVRPSQNPNQSGAYVDDKRFSNANRRYRYHDSDFDFTDKAEQNSSFNNTKHHLEKHRYFNYRSPAWVAAPSFAGSHSDSESRNSSPHKQNTTNRRDSDEKISKTRLLSNTKKHSIRNQSGRRRNSDSPNDDNFSTTVTVSEEIGDRLSLGDDDFEFHPANVKDAKLLAVAKDLEGLLGEQILTPYSRKKRNRFERV